MNVFKEWITMSKVWFFISAIAIGVALKNEYLATGVWFFGCGIEATLKEG